MQDESFETWRSEGFAEDLFTDADEGWPGRGYKWIDAMLGALPLVVLGACVLATLN